MDSTELVRKIERQDRAWRVVVALVLLFMVAAQTVLIILVLQADNRLEIATREIDRQATEYHTSTDAQLKALQEQHRQQDQYILCLAELFSNNKPDATCIPPFPKSEVGPISSDEPSVPTSSNTESVKLSSPTPPAPSPGPAPKPTPLGQILKDIRQLTGGIL